MYEEFVPERLAKLRLQKGVSARDMSLSLGQANNYEENLYPKTLQEFIAEAKKLDSKSMTYILGIMKELNSKK